MFHGERMVLRGKVEQVTVDDAGCGFAEVSVKLSVGERTCTECSARIARPVCEGDNSWKRRGADWKP